MDGSGARPRDDRVLAPARWTAIGIIPVLVAAWAVLYLFPGRTEDLWAWTIRPDMTALVMGGGYLSGAYLFARVAREREWHRVAVAFVATTVFTTVLLAATVLHWDRFNHGHVSFWAWLGLYIVTPLLLPWLWGVNRRTDPGVPGDGDVEIPRRLRTLVAMGGSLQLGVAALMFLVPEQAADAWPWALTPLTARTISAFVAFPAVSWLCFAWESRWSSFRIPLQTATLGLVIVGLGALRATDDFDGPAASRVLFVVALLGSIGLLAWVQLAMDGRTRPAVAVPREPGDGPPAVG